MSGDPVEVVVPAACARRLRDEAAEHLAVAAENVAEAVTELRHGRDHVRLDDADRPRYREADAVWPQACRRGSDGTVTVVASRSTVAALLRSCARGTADELRQLVDEPWSSQAVRRLAGELEGWAAVFEVHGLSTAPDPRGGC